MWSGGADVSKPAITDLALGVPGPAGRPDPTIGTSFTGFVWSNDHCSDHSAWSAMEARRGGPADPVRGTAPARRLAKGGARPRRRRPVNV